MNVASSQTSVVVIIPCLYSRAFLYTSDLVVPHFRYHLPSSAASFFLSERCASPPQDGNFFLLSVKFASVWFLGRYMGCSVCLVPQAIWPCRGNAGKSYHCLDRYQAPPEGTSRIKVYSLWEYLRLVDERLLSNTKSVCTKLISISDNKLNLCIRCEIV